MSLKDRCALVTGASAGIGRAFAEALARRGANLVLTARRADRLEVLAADLKSRYAIRTDVIVADLAAQTAAQQIHAELGARGIAIDMLVNNAGYGVPGAFNQQPWSMHADFIQVLMTTPVELAYRLLPAMQQRAYGRIINVASLAGHVPGSAGHTLYGASKAFMIKFSQSLALENRTRGVNVCALCPGFTYSEFHDVTGARALVSRMPKWMWMDADVVAEQGIDAVERGDIVYVNGRINRAIKAFTQLLPDRLALALIARQSRHFRVAERDKPAG
jgi:short-subunit dehydrogenase